MLATSQRLADDATREVTMVQVRQFPWEVLEYIVSEVPTTYPISVLPRAIQVAPFQLF